MTDPLDAAKERLQAQATAEQKLTDYLVLEMRLWPSEDERIVTWTPLSISSGKSKNEAIDALVGDREGTFKAIAASSWKGGKTIKQVTKAESTLWEDGL